MQPAVFHHPRLHGESSTVFIAHLHAHRPLRPSDLGPEPLEHFSCLGDLDERAARVVSGSHERRKIAPRLDRLLF